MFGVLLDSLRDRTIFDYLLSTSPKNKIIFLVEGGRGGSGNNDHGFPFFGDVELVDPSLGKPQPLPLRVCCVMEPLLVGDRLEGSPYLGERF